jgi:D-lactate dehydrogenase
MISCSFYDTKAYDREYFQKGYGNQEVEWRFNEFRLSKDTAFSAAGSAAVCAFVNDRLDRVCLEVLRRQEVKHIALRCAGFNNVDLSVARELGFVISRVPAYSPHAVAEHAVALLLSLNRKIHRAYNRVREHNFSLAGLVGFDLQGKTVGIIGTGKIGRVVAKIFRGFECRVIAHDPFPQIDWSSSMGIEYVGLQELLQKSHMVSLHLPLSPETKFLINRERLDSMKDGAFLINTSRGKLVDTQALIEVLKSGKLGGVALDVYEEEEGVFFEDLSNNVLQDDELSRLLTFPNVLVTSHQAFLTEEALKEIARVTTQNILAVAHGGLPHRENLV